MIVKMAVGHLNSCHILVGQAQSILLRLFDCSQKNRKIEKLKKKYTFVKKI
jgi:hypothetical protein